jgi:pimeloyl-ACP methyl ester carboxylesterase
VSKLPVENGIYYSVSELGTVKSIPIVLIHGAGGSSLGWHSLLRRMPGMKIITPDLPGHGKSDGAGRQSINDYACDIYDFIHTLKLPRVILAGHSMGGAIAIQTALLAPERVIGLIVVSSGAVCNIPEEIVQSLSNPEMMLRAVDWLCEKLRSPRDGQNWVDQTRQALMKTRQGILYGDLYTCLHTNLEEECGNIRVPTLVCTGKHDRFIPPVYSRHLAELIPKAKVAELDGGHLLPLERPEELVILFQEFQKSIKII